MYLTLYIEGNFTVYVYTDYSICITVYVVRIMWGNWGRIDKFWHLWPFVKLYASFAKVYIFYIFQVTVRFSTTLWCP